jgi:integrase
VYNDTKPLALYVPGVEDEPADLEKWLNLNFVISSVKDRREIAQKFRNAADRFMVRFFGKDSILLKDNSTHSLRKLYASYSWLLYGQGTQQSFWYQHLLGHRNPMASFAYMNLAIQPGLKVVETDQSRLLQKIGAMKTDLEHLQGVVDKIKKKEEMK